MNTFVFEPAEQPSLAVAGGDARFPVHRIYCIGRNYADHAREMGATVERGQPMFFTKPADAIVADDGRGIDVPGGRVGFSPQETALYYDLSVRETLVFHAGAVQGYRGVIAFLPKYRFGMVMLWNCESALPAGLMPMLMDRYLNLPQVDWAGVERLDSDTIAVGGE